ncbi:DUF6067 family protein, partial [bacterium]|nr:DUF6067 family protein [bacterium]
MYRKSALILFIIILCAFAATVQGTVQQSAPASLQSPGAMLASGAWGSLWNVSSMRSIMPDTKLAASKANAVRLSAARNEFEPFQLVLRPLKQLKNVKVVPHVLSGPAGANIGAWNINVRNVGYVKTAASTSNPDPLPDFKPFTAVAGANSAMWVTVYVPDKTTPGDYRGTVDIMADGLAKITVPVVVHVWNFTLPSVSSLRTAFACDFNEAARQHNASTLEEKRKLVELYDLDFWRHRVAPMVPYAFHDIKASLDGDRLSLDFSDFDVAVKKLLPLFNSFNLPS